MGPEAVGIPFGRILTSHLRGASAAFRVGAEEIPSLVILQLQKQ